MAAATQEEEVTQAEDVQAGAEASAEEAIHQEALAVHHIEAEDRDQDMEALHIMDRDRIITEDRDILHQEDQSDTGEIQAVDAVQYFLQFLYLLS